MVNRALMKVQDMVNAFVDSRPQFWKTNAVYVGSLNYLSLGDGVEKLKAQVRNLKRHHRMTKTDTEAVKQITTAIASLSPRPVPSRRRRVAASR
jgi:hypothetical protein